ncbi:hypothetical protein RFI_03376, partial [Reticulomyxa filosa]
NSIGNSNVICSGSTDNTIRFWDIRSNKNELYMIKGDDKEDNGIFYFKFIELKKKDKTKNVTYDLNLCYEVKVFFFEKFDQKKSEVILNLFLHSMFFKEFKIMINENSKINCNVVESNTIVFVVIYEYYLKT